jgi:hypothetical protein
MRITVIPPDKSIQETDKHILSDSLLEAAISGQCTELCINEDIREGRMMSAHRKVSLRIFSLTAHGPRAT